MNNHQILNLPLRTSELVNIDLEKIIQDGKKVLEVEAQEILNVKNSIDESFALSIKAILGAKGKCIITGMGKSGIIGKKIAASLSSTGTPSFFVHPGEAFHGDLGMFGKDDIVVLLSNSGETDEVLKLLSFFKNQGNQTISITGKQESTLARNTTFHISCKVSQESCPLQLAPTASTTAMLAVGDAIVVALMKLRNFQPEQFAIFHPGGSLGRNLLTHVRDVMSINNLPVVKADTNLKDMINIMSQCGYGMAVQLDDKDCVVGIITDGDLRRALDDYGDTFFNQNTCKLVKKNPASIGPNATLIDAKDLIKSKSVKRLLVLENMKLLGIF